jgi:hypothetical protein
MRLKFGFANFSILPCPESKYSSLGMSLPKAGCVEIGVFDSRYWGYFLGRSTGANMAVIVPKGSADRVSESDDMT